MRARGTARAGWQHVHPTGTSSRRTRRDLTAPEQHMLRETSLGCISLPSQSWLSTAHESTAQRDLCRGSHTYSWLQNYPEKQKVNRNKIKPKEALKVSCRI